MLYFCRHGETLYNRDNRWIGQRDIGLSQAGEEHIHQVAQKLKAIQFDEIHSSPLIRARKTADIIWEAQLIPPPLYFQPWLSERGYGVLEGRDKTEQQRHQLDDFAGVEPLSSFRDRLHLIQQLDFQSRDILVVAHSGVFKCLITYCGFHTASGQTRIGHGELVALEREGAQKSLPTDFQS